MSYALFVRGGGGVDSRGRTSDRSAKDKSVQNGIERTRGGGGKGWAKQDERKESVD